MLYWECRSMYSGTDEKDMLLSFLKDNDKCDRWIRALPNKINNFTKHTGVCEKNWATVYKKSERNDRPHNAPSIF